MPSSDEHLEDEQLIQLTIYDRVPPIKSATFPAAALLGGAAEAPSPLWPLA